MTQFSLQIFSSAKDNHQDVPLYDFPEEDDVGIHAERTLHISCEAMASLSLSLNSPVKCSITGLSYKDEKLPKSPSFILFIMNTPDLPANYAFVNRRVITSHVPEYFTTKNVRHSDVSKAKISIEDVLCFSPAQTITFTVFDVLEKDSYSMTISMKRRIKNSFPLTSPFLFKSGDKFKIKIGFPDYVMEVASVIRNEEKPYFCLKEHKIINKEDKTLKSYSRSEQCSDQSDGDLYYFVDKDTRVNFSFPSTTQPDKPESDIINYCPYIDGIVSRLSSTLVKVMNSKIKSAEQSYGQGGCGLIVYGDKGSLKREIIAKSVEEANFTLVERDLKIIKEENWLKLLLTEAHESTPSVILVTSGEFIFNEQRGESGREAVALVVENLLKSLKKEILLIVSCEEPQNVSEKLKTLLASSFYINLPVKKEREAIIKKILSEKMGRSISDEDVEKVAEKTRRLSVRELCSEKEYEKIEKEDTEIGIKISSKMPKKTWDAIKGYSTVKSALMSPIEQYRRDTENHSFESLLLFGPPGCSKVLFIRTLSEESGFPLVKIQGSHYRTFDVYKTVKSLQAYFCNALKKVPSILYIEDLDLLCHMNTKSESKVDLVSEIKKLIGQCASNGTQKVLIIAASEKPSNIDQSLLEKGFFTRFVHLDLPSCEDRCAIWKHNIDNINTKGEIDTEALCEASKGFSVSEIHVAFSLASLKMNRKKPIKASGVVSDEEKKEKVDKVSITQKELLHSIREVKPATEASLLKELQDFKEKYKSQLA